MFLNPNTASHYSSLLAAVVLLNPSFGDEISTSEKTTQPKLVEMGNELFTLKVMPVFREKCAGCHGNEPDDLKGEFSILSLNDLLKGGESGEPAIQLGKPHESYLVSAIKWEESEMPPKENDRLTSQQIAWIEKWIQLGAPWPSESLQKQILDANALVLENEDGRIVPTSGGQTEQWTNRRYTNQDLWAFLPLLPKATQNPTGVPRAKVIDELIAKTLQQHRLVPAQDALPEELIRRATYDLTGLPPTYAEIQQFKKDYRREPEKSWNDLIEKLLDSPRYGEHWGRHWLDVTRYADTGGMSNDYERSNLWRYRDYVIRSFNSDKRYDQFIREQLAGDEMADIARLERETLTRDEIHRAQEKGDYNEQEAEWIIATGFLRLGPWDNAMVEDEEARQIYLDDLVNITGQTFLSQTLRCVKCHDHKFDPIPTRDYYRIYAAFSTTQMAERNVPFLASENRQRFQEQQAHVETMLAYARSEKEKIIAVQEDAAKKWYQEHQLPYKNENQRRNDDDEVKPPRHVGLNYVQLGQRKVREQDEWIWNRRLERYQPMAQSVYNADTAEVARRNARMLRISRKKQDTATTTNHILIGGALTAVGAPVVPGVLSAIGVASSENLNAPFTLTESTNGRRLELANWIVSESNPLTARSIVNRIWQFHFGKGIAANTNNFGAKGAKPTHPALLDYLANDFMENGWSIKSLHRLIMKSSTYKRSTRHPKGELLDEKDPDNQYLAKFPRRRLLAEELRDSILHSSGELIHEMGGLPVMPEINMEVALQPRMIQFSIAPAYQPSLTARERNRRSIYAYQVRGQADPFSELFNQPNPNESCELRESAAVTPQAFALLNSEMMSDRSVAVAIRVLGKQQSQDTQRQASLKPDAIQAAFRLILKRDASPQEIERLSHYGSKMIAYHKQNPPTPVIYPTKITRSLVEEFTGRPFEYEEILPVFENYQSDIKADQVTPQVRALADICLLLFNTNEFIYVE